MLEIKVEMEEHLEELEFKKVIKVSATKKKAKFFKPWHIMFVIDNHPSMFEDVDGENTSFKKCLNALLDVADSSLIRTTLEMKSPLGVYLADNDLEKASIIDFHNNMPENVKLLRNLCDLPSRELQFMYQRKDPFDLAHFLLLCKHQLDKLNTDVYKNTIVYITNDSDPAISDENMKDTVKDLVLKQFVDSNVYLKIVTLNDQFDIEPFYNHIFQCLKFVPVQYVASGEDLTELLSSYLQVNNSKFSYKFYPVCGNWKKYIKVSKMSFTKPCDIKKNAIVTKSDHTQVKKVEFESKVNTPKEVVIKNPTRRKNSPVIKMFKYNVEKVLKTDEFPVGITLLYTSEKLSKPFWVIKPMSFIVSHFSDTSKLFDALWKSLVETDLVMICYFKTKATGKLRFVELEPKVIDNVNAFTCKVIPSTEHIRELAGLRLKPTREDLEELMEDIVDKLSFDFTPKLFRNLKYKKKEEYIKSQLLGDVFHPVDPQKDGAEETKRKIDLVIPEEGQKFKKLFPGLSAGIKRKRD